jgi:hypothetical protein
MARGSATPLPPSQPPPGWARHAQKCTAHFAVANCPQTPCNPVPSARDRRVCLREQIALSCRPSDHVPAKPSRPVIHCQRAVHPRSSGPQTWSIQPLPPTPRPQWNLATPKDWGFYEGQGHFGGRGGSPPLPAGVACGRTPTKGGRMQHPPDRLGDLPPPWICTP